MTKLTQDFQISYPVQKRTIVGLRIKSEHVGDLIVTGTAYQYETGHSVDIDFVRWNGTDIRPVLEVTGGMEQIEEYILQRASKFFTQTEKLAA